MTEQEVAQDIKEQIDKLEFIKIINVYSFNVDGKKRKGKPIPVREYLRIIYLIKDLYLG